MGKIRILIEMAGDTNVAKAAAAFAADTGAEGGADGAKAMMKSKTVSAADGVKGLSIDTDFGVAVVTDIAAGGPAAGFAATDGETASGDAPAAFDMQPPISQTYLMRAECEAGEAERIADELLAQDGVIGVFADVAIEPCLICPGSPPLGDHHTVERLLCTDALHRAGATGEGVLVAIVDTGINLARLAAKGKHPAFDATRSWVPRAGLVPGNLPVGHGTMCAFDVCIAAPKCTLLDIALLQSTATGATRMEGFLSDAVRAYNHLITVMRAPRRPGETRSLVVNNSWGMFHPSWDFPLGHPGNYSDNPNHPFNRIVATLASHGADILFAAGNCGSDCPDGRCQGVTTNAIYGANSHPEVLSVAGGDTGKTRVGYSSKGPGRLARNKPDISGYTHFSGSGVYAADGGTSAACPVVAGVVAAIRTKRPFIAGNPARTPAAIRSLVTGTAEDLGSSGYDFLHGFGVVNGCAIARQLQPLVIDICRRFPHLCRPVPVPPDLCRRFPQLCRPIPPLPPIPPIPPVPPLPPIPPRPGLDADAGDPYAWGWQGAAAMGGVLDLGDGSALSQLGLDDLAELFYYLGQIDARAGAARAAPPAPAPARPAGGGCGCGG